MKAAALIGGTFMKKITLKRQPVYRRQPEQAVVRPDLVERLQAFTANPANGPASDFLIELSKCLSSSQYRAQTQAIKKIGTLILSMYGFLLQSAITHFIGLIGRNYLFMDLFMDLFMK